MGKNSSNLSLSYYILIFNPIRSGGVGALITHPPNFCPDAFSFVATLLWVGDFSQKIVQLINTAWGKKFLTVGQDLTVRGV